MIKAILFDAGGVFMEKLSRSDSPLVQGLSSAYHVRSEDIIKSWSSHFDTHDTGQRSLAEHWTIIGKECSFTPDMAFVIELYKKSFKEIPGTVDIVKRLKGRYLLVLANNELEEVDNMRYEALGYHDLFDRRFSSWMIGKRKPNRDYFEHIIAEIKLKPEECIFIDDHEENIATARALGILTILFQDAEQLETDLKALGVEF
ncbi:MAG: HAD family phosphatase [Nanoarchaeota archaeon]